MWSCRDPFRCQQHGFLCWTLFDEFACFKILFVCAFMCVWLPNCMCVKAFPYLWCPNSCVWFQVHVMCGQFVGLSVEHTWSHLQRHGRQHRRYIHHQAPSGESSHVLTHQWHIGEFYLWHTEADKGKSYFYWFSGDIWLTQASLHMWWLDLSFETSPTFFSSVYLTHAISMVSDKGKRATTAQNISNRSFRKDAKLKKQAQK